ncbi:MAG: SPOR domain-containing protein [Sulfuriferula sp.]
MAIQATSEEQLRLKKRARQRLLGAGALLLTAAIVLPMVLDQSPRQPNQDVVIDMGDATPSAPATPGRPTPIQDEQPPAIPLPVEVAKVQVMPTQPKVEASVPEPMPAKKSHAEEAAKPVHVDAPKVVARPEVKAEVKVETKAEKPAVKPAPQPTLKVEPKAESKAKTKTITPVHDEKHDEKPASTQHFVVQLGAFSNAENVQQLRDRLSAAGVSTYTEKLPSGATRVRVGPYADKAQAAQALAKVNAAGVQAQVVPLK